MSGLRLLLRREGRLLPALIKNCVDVASPSTHYTHSAARDPAYQLIGYGDPEQFGPIDLRQRTQTLRDDLIANIVATFPDNVSIFRLGGRWRSRLCFRDGLVVSSLIARSINVWKNTVRWQTDPVSHERDCITLLARIDRENPSFLQFYVLPSVNRPKRFQISELDQWPLLGEELTNTAWKLAITERLETRELARRKHLDHENNSIEGVFSSKLELPVSGYNLPLDRGWDCERIVVRATADEQESSASSNRWPLVTQQKVLIKDFKYQQDNDTKTGDHLEVHAVMSNALSVMTRHRIALKRDLYKAIDTLHKVQEKRREREKELNPSSPTLRP